MVITAMSAMMERMGPMSVHVVSTRAPRGGPRRLARRVYRQMRRDFFVASPFVLHASVPELLAGAWSVVRESLFTGNVPRGKKEVVASAVSVANQCPFCIGAHQAAVNSVKADDASLKTWAEASNRADAEALRNVPFPAEERAEYFGTIVAFHYLNRMVSAFLDDKLMPNPDFMDPMANSMATFMMGGMIRKGRRNDPGDSVNVRPEFDASLGWRPAWAESAPHIADAIQAWSAINEQAARQHLGDAFVDSVGGVLDAWNGGGATMGTGWLDDVRPEVEPSQREAADLALIVAMAPYMVDDDRLKSVIAAGMTKEQLLVTVAWAAQRAARRAGTWVSDAADASTETSSSSTEAAAPAPPA